MGKRAHLESQDFRLDETEWLAVDFDEASTLLAVGDCGGGLLLAEALDTLGRRHVGDMSGCGRCEEEPLR